MKRTSVVRLSLIFAVVCSVVLGPKASQSVPMIPVPAGADPSLTGGSTGVHLIGAIAVPGGYDSRSGPFDIGFGSSTQHRVFITNRVNPGVDIFDSQALAWIGRVLPGPGQAPFFGGGGPTGGPSGVILTPDNVLWIGDSPALLRIADLKVDTIVTQTITVGPPADGRADEIDYSGYRGTWDGSYRQVMIGVDHGTPPYVSIYDANTFALRAKISFPDATGMEQPAWNPYNHLWMVNVPAAPNSYIALIDPDTFYVVGKFLFPNIASCNGSANGLIVSPNKTMMASACRLPIVMDARTGAQINLVRQVQGGDQVAYGGSYFWVTATGGIGGDNPAPAATPKVVGAIHAGSGQLVKSILSPGARNGDWADGTFFTMVAPTAAGTPDTSACFAVFNLSQGCVLLYAESLIINLDPPV